MRFPNETYRGSADWIVVEDSFGFGFRSWIIFQFDIGPRPTREAHSGSGFYSFATVGVNASKLELSAV